MKPIFRSATRGLWPALPVVFLSTVAAAQSGGVGFEFDSAVDSHRGLNDDGAPPPPMAVSDDGVERDTPRVDAEPLVGNAAREGGAKGAGDRPAPVDPVAAMTPDADERGSTSSVRQPGIAYDSAVEEYAERENPAAPGWAEANERVGEIGGWREYAKELYTPAPETGTATPEPMPEPNMGAAETLPATAAKPAGDRPMPVDPAEAMAPDESERTPEPSMPKAALEYDSVLADYDAYEESDGPNWIEANERVGEIGGWREYAKELFEPAAAATGDGR